MAAPRPLASKFGIPHFYGIDAQEADNFLFILDNEREAYNWNDATVKRYFFQSLKSKGFAWYRADQQTLAAKTWEELKTEFKRVFQKSDTNWTTFLKREQSASESATDYVLDKLRLKTLAGVNVPDRELIQQIIEGLRPEYMEAIYLHSNENLDQLKRNIEKIDTLKKRHPVQEICAVSNYETAPQQFQRLEANLIHRLETMIAAFQATNIDAGRLQNTQCFRCKGFGHVQASCSTPEGLFKNPKDPLASKNNSQLQASASSQVQNKPRERSIERDWRPKQFPENHKSSRSRDASLERARSGAPKCANCDSFRHSAPSCPHPPNHALNPSMIPKNGNLLGPH